MHESWTLLIALHALGATAAVIVGGCLLLRRRKGDLLHRRIGRLWMADMYWVAFSSFGIKRLNPGHFSWIHGLSLWTIVSLTVAIWAAATHRVQQHRGWVIGTYCGLVGAGVAAVAFPTRLVPQTAMHRPWWLVGGLLAAAAIAALAIEAAARLPGRSTPGEDRLLEVGNPGGTAVQRDLAELVEHGGRRRMHEAVEQR
jgi:uncharacterized membrane protein